MGNNIEKLPLKKRIITGTFSGLFYASMMTGFHYYEHKTFSLPTFLLNAVAFGLVMGYVFRHKVTKAKD